MIVARATACLKLLVVTGALTIPAMHAQAAIELMDRIELPGSTGRLDHLAIDIQGRRLFVAALGADAVEVVDTQERKRVLRLRGREPQGLAYLPSVEHLLIANGGNGSIDVFVGGQRKGGLADLPDVDNLRLDAKPACSTPATAMAWLWWIRSTCASSIGSHCLATPSRSNWRPTAPRSTSTYRADDA